MKEYLDRIVDRELKLHLEKKERCRQIDRCQRLFAKCV